jgi:hypothetical protein
MATFGTPYATTLHRREAMTCKSCTSANSGKFSAEIKVHFGGWEGLKRPGVMVFPKLLVCMDCGFTEFAIPERELAGLANGYEKALPQDIGRAHSQTRDYARIATSDPFDDGYKMDA